MEIDEQPSTSGRERESRQPAAGPGNKPLAAGGANSSGGAGAAPAAAAAPGGKPRRRRSPSMEKWAAPQVENWWLSESEEEEEEEGDGMGAGGGEEGGPLKAGEEDPLYDPDADEEDEKWADRQRGGRPTDAILSCPGCFTTVCLECQQHELYHTRYRAVFTVNCSVEEDAPMRVHGGSSSSRGGGAAAAKESGGGGGGGGRKRKGAPEGGGQAGFGGGEEEETGEEMLPVVCDVCGTVVGAQDSEEIVHFYHVLASNP